MWSAAQNRYLLCIVGGVALVYTVWRAGWKVWFHPLWALGSTYTNWFFAAGAGLIVYGLLGLSRGKSDDDP